MSETPMNKLRALCEKWQRPNINIRGDGGEGSTDISYSATRLQCAAQLRAILPDVERLPCPICGEELSGGISWCKTCDTTHAVRSVECHPCGYISTGPCELGKKDVKALREALSWALDLLDMYDELLIKMGEPREKVYSSIHLQGKEKARVALADQPVAPKETK